MIELDVNVPKPTPHGHAIGIDVGILNMLSTSDGLVIPRPKFLDQALRKIQLLQRKLKKKVLGSKNWKKLQHRIDRDIAASMVIRDRGLNISIHGHDSG